MIAGREIGNAKTVLRAKVLPVGAILLYQPISKSLAVAGEKVDGSNGDGYLIVAPGGGHAGGREKKFSLVSCYQVLYKKMRYRWTLEYDQWIKSHQNIWEPNINFLIRRIIMEFGTTKDGQIRKSIFFPKSCDTLCLKIKTGNAGISSYPEFVANNDQGRNIIIG